jgi:peptide/nickel transport system substrate-binding protein
MEYSKRDVLKLGAFGAAALTGGLVSGSAFAQADTLSIAYNVNLPSWDPTAGPSAVNPTLQGIYQSVFDQYVAQKPDLAFTPGLLTEWGWTDSNKKVRMKVRKGVTWHDGSPFTPEDVVWSIERAGKPETGNPVAFVWANLSNFAIADDVITADAKQFDPSLFPWMAFLTAYVLPKAYYTKVGAEGFEAKPIGTGPYMVEKYERNAFVRLKANPSYWGAKPAYETVIIKFVPDASSRVAEVESGKSQISFDMPYEEYDRLKAKKGFVGAATPITDIAMIFLTNVEPVMLDKNVRLAACHAIDKKLLVSRLLKGYGVPIDTLQAPSYAAYDPSIKVPYDPELAKKLLAASGYSPDKPAKFTIQTTKGYKPKDFEIIQAIVGMWRKVGIEANIEVYDIAKHFELRFGHKLAPAAFYNWGNSIGDPSTSTGAAMFGPSPHCAWKSDDLNAMIGPLFGEPDEAKRIAGYKAVDKYIAEQGYVIPLFQYVQPLIHASTVAITPDLSGAVLPLLAKPA